MQTEQIELEAEDFLQRIDAVTPISTWAIAEHCGLTVTMEGVPVAERDVRGVALTIPRTSDLHVQELAIGKQLGAWRLRLRFKACTADEAAHCGRAIQLPRVDLQRDLVRLRTEMSRRAETDELIETLVLRALMRQHVYASERLIRERIEDLERLSFSRSRLRLVAP